MTQKNITHQFSLHLPHSKIWTAKHPQNSMISSKYIDTQRSDRFIPAEFKAKTHHEDRIKQEQKLKQFKNIQTSTTNGFKKYQFEKISQKRLSFEMQPPQIKNFQGTLEENLKIKKSIVIKDIAPDNPKLRQTNSTLCQSPKANTSLFQSKASDFKKIKLLGKGKFGDVYLVKHIYTGFIAALKIIPKIDLLCGTAQQNQKALNQLMRQIKLQSFMDHPNLIKLYDYFSDENFVYLLLQLACDGHLYDFLEKNKRFKEETTSILVREITNGIDYMHKHQIIHRDIKLQNIVLCHGMAKICDFGWSVHCPKQFRTTLCGTPLYLSPEILQGKKYNKKIDTWAIGALTHELITAENPFKIRNKEQLSKIITQDFVMNSGSPQLKSFITFILRKNPSKRPDTDTILRHPFIQKYRDLDTCEEICQISYQYLFQ